MATQAYREDLRRFWRAHNTTSSTHQTSGLCALVHAASTCKVINMFGFGGPEGGVQKALYHFWDVGVSETDMIEATNGFHDYMLERRIYDELSSAAHQPGICVHEPPEGTVLAEVEGMLKAERSIARTRLRRAKMLHKLGKRPS
jgi:hypothetical protein